MFKLQNILKNNTLAKIIKNTGIIIIVMWVINTMFFYGEFLYKTPLSNNFIRLLINGLTIYSIYKLDFRKWSKGKQIIIIIIYTCLLIVSWKVAEYHRTEEYKNMENLEKRSENKLTIYNKTG